VVAVTNQHLPKLMSSHTFYPPFCDLAGSIFLTLPSGLDLQNLSALISENKALITTQPNKLKVIFDNYDLDTVQSEFENRFQGAKITPYNSNFFKLTKDQVKALFFKSPQLDWTGYQGEFIIKPYSRDQKEILINILLNSFAVNFTRDEEGKSVITTNETKSKYILENFEKHSSNPNLHTFIVYSKAAEVVGTFGLTVVGGEVQLSAVAGRFVDFEKYVGYKGAKKLPLISAAFVEVFTNHEDFVDIKALTFSNSKPSVIQFYNDLRFDNNLERKGFIIDFNC
jgi:hypothetical protein